MNARDKGARGERELATTLSQLGFPARRGQQFCGGPGSPDVVCDALSAFHIECKRTERTDLYGWMRQAAGDAGTAQTPVVMHRKNNEDWLVVMRLSDFVRFVK